MKLQINEYKNAQLISSKEEETSLETLQDLDLSYVSSLIETSDFSEIVSTSEKRYFIYAMFLKDTTIPVYLSADGVFFSFTPSGDEIVLDEEIFNWGMLPVGAYHEHILKTFDHQSLEILLID